MSRIRKGPVNGISLKLQEEERERRMEFVPEESCIKTDKITVDDVVGKMLHDMGLHMSNVEVIQKEEEEKK